MASAVINSSTILMFVGVCFADVADLNNPGSITAPQVTEWCLSCICQAASGCKQSLGCEDGACGLFRITEPYWIDGGRHTVDGAIMNPQNDKLKLISAFNNCTFEPYCAARTVQGYMKKYAKDCNGDGQVNCYDYMAIHKMGPNSCMNDVPFEYVSVFNQCMAAVAAQQNHYHQS